MATPPKPLHHAPRPVHRSRTRAASAESEPPDQDPPDPPPAASAGPAPQPNPAPVDQHDAQGDQPPSTAKPTTETPAEVVAVNVLGGDRVLMRARLAAMAAPRDTDTPQVAALRAILRDQALMAHVTANVERWPPLTDEQRHTLAALLHRPVRRTAARPRRRAV